MPPGEETIFGPLALGFLSRGSRSMAAPSGREMGRLPSYKSPIEAPDYPASLVAPHFGVFRFVWTAQKKAGLE